MSSPRPTVAVLGAGASGALVALHLLRAASGRCAGLRVVLVDPAQRWGRGVAFGTTDEAHLLNVPAAGMSALPDDPSHFVTSCGATDPAAFLPRCRWGTYLVDLLGATARAVHDRVRLEHLRSAARGVRRTRAGLEVLLADHRALRADAVVVATGLPGVGVDWAPPQLLDSPFFVSDPWAPGALEVVRRDHVGHPDVLVVGTGLTMVDVVLSATGAGARPDRRVHAISRSGRLPLAHREQLVPAVVPDVTRWGCTLDDVLADVRRHVDAVVAATGDWRPAVDGLRFRVAELWQRLGEADRRRFLAEHAADWNVRRHRMPPSSAAALAAARSSGTLHLAAATVVGARPTAGGLVVELSDGTVREVGWVVNCTGPRADIRTLGNPLLDDLLRPHAGVARATIATAGMGLRTEQGRLVDSNGSAEAPIWTLGALRRGELWESTAVPEIAAQASAVATAVLDAVAPALPRSATALAATP